MVTFDKEITIERPLQEVFDYVSDPANDPEWRMDVEVSEWTSEGPPSVGSISRSVSKFLGRTMETTAEVTAWDPPKHFAFKSVGGPFPFEFSVTLEEQGNSTMASIHGQAEVAGFFKLAEGLVAKQTQKQFDKEFEALKVLLESR
jgi:carbon monoxide dehydrogenase subunit G